MSRELTIERIVMTRFSHQVSDLELEDSLGFDTVYRKGGRLDSGGSVIRIETSSGVSGEALGGIDARTAKYLIGRNPLDRETIWHDLKRSRRAMDGTPPGAVDVALWDFAGKLYGAPIWELLGGGFRRSLPAYASTYHGDENGGLTTAEDYAQFALRCKREFGYPAFKIHGWVNGPIEREVDAVLAIRKAVGPEMDLMLDPAGCFETFEDVLRVGRACDEAKYMWYEDPFRGGGFSRFAHAKLRDFIKTPMLMGEHVRGLEAKADTITSEATDFVRANANSDGGITGVMKLAALAEAHGLDVELHGGGLAHRHIMSSLKNSNYYELGLVHPLVSDTKPPIYSERRWLDELDSVDASGCVEVPYGPGLGVEFDHDYIMANRTDEDVYE